MGLVQLWAICEVVADYQHLIQLLHLQLLGCLGDLALPLDDAPQRCLVPLVVVGLFPLGINAQVLLYVLLDGDPAVVDIDGRTEDIDFLEDSAVLLQNHADQRHGFAGLGDVAVLHSPFFGSGKLEYYLATRRPALEVRGVDAFEPVANLHRCYLKQDPVFLRSLLRLAGRKIDRRFYFSRLLPGTQRGRAGRRAACSYVLLRNSFSGKWGSFAQQRPLALSSVRRTQRPPTNVTVRCQDALGYLRALPSQAPRHCIYADPPYIFPGRSMNYYGTRRRGHDLAFHSELRDALFASGLPFLVSINDVPEAWELYSRAGSITRLCSGKNSSKPELLVLHQGNLCVAQEWPEQSCRQRRIDWGNPVANTGLPGPHQVRTRPARWRGICNGACVFFFTHFEDFSAVSQTMRICKFSGEHQRNTRPANLKKLTV